MGRGSQDSYDVIDVPSHQFPDVLSDLEGALVPRHGEVDVNSILGFRCGLWDLKTSFGTVTSLVGVTQEKGS